MAAEAPETDLHSTTHEAEHYRELGEAHGKANHEGTPPLVTEGVDEGRIADKNLALEAAYAVKPQIDSTHDTTREADEEATAHEARATRSRSESKRDEHLVSTAPRRLSELMAEAFAETDEVVVGAGDAPEAERVKSVSERVKSVAESHDMAMKMDAGYSADVATNEARRRLDKELGMGDVVAVTDYKEKADQAGDKASEAYRAGLRDHLSATLSPDGKKIARTMLADDDLKYDRDLDVALGTKIAPFYVEKSHGKDETHWFRCETSPSVLVAKRYDTETGKLLGLVTLNQPSPTTKEHPFYSQVEIRQSKIDHHADPRTPVLENSLGARIRHRLRLPENQERPNVDLHDAAKETLEIATPLTRSERRAGNPNTTKPADISVAEWVMASRGATDDDFSAYRRANRVASYSGGDHAPLFMRRLKHRKTSWWARLFQ